MKICKKCGEEKALTEFGIDKRYNKPKSYCKPCMSTYCKRWREKNPEKFKAAVRNWVEKTGYDHAAYTREWRKKNHERWRNRVNNHQRERLKRDPVYKISRNLRRAIWGFVNGELKTGSAVRDLGCSIDELRSHLENMFQEGMTWDNYGEWHIDHIVPLSSFDLEDREQLLKACHYTNLQPLWALDNLRKGAKIQ
jgi:hypothetical protein